MIANPPERLADLQTSITDLYHSTFCPVRACGAYLRNFGTKLLPLQAYWVISTVQADIFLFYLLIVGTEMLIL